LQSYVDRFSQQPAECRGFLPGCARFLPIAVIMSEVILPKAANPSELFVCLIGVLRRTQDYFTHMTACQH
ncbi:hypothetical protein NL287_26260, partial [Klebsiella pneumoniae]|nr:hypothetical protein [Klebsiella pneumoniae]